MPNPNPALRPHIAALSDGLRTSQQIADLVGKSKNYVYELVREMALPRPSRGSGKPRQRTADSKARIVQISALADGLRSSAEIAELCGSTTKYVQRILLELDLPRLPQAAPIGARNASYAGGRHVDHDGYVLISAPIGHPHARIPPGRNVGRIYEHRIVLERVLGRYLLPTEVVDHVDGLHLHNHPDNLRVFASNADHLRATISGQIPRWSNEGLQKMYLSNHRERGLPVVDSYRLARERGDVRLRQILRARLSLGEDSPYLLGTRRWLERAGIIDHSRSSLELHLRRLDRQ